MRSNPEGFEGSFSSGLVSAIRITDPPQIQITAPISHGSSGGPVLNRLGQVIGMVQSTFSEGQNLNFAVPSALISVALAAYVADPRATSEYAWNAITEDKLPDWKLVHHGDGLATYYAADSITTIGEGRRSMWVLVRTTWPNSEDTFMNLMAFDCTRRWSVVLKFYRPGEPVIDKNPDSWTEPEETTLVNIACGKRINVK